MSAKAGKTQIQPPRAPGIAELRSAIDKAETEGIARGDMLLRLTFRDEAMLKRSSTVGVDEVSFADGEMRFVGVRVVVSAGATMSSLEAPVEVSVGA
jgi:hypothetical protein